MLLYGATECMKRVHVPCYNPSRRQTLEVSPFLNNLIIFAFNLYDVGTLIKTGMILNKFHYT